MKVYFQALVSVKTCGKIIILKSSHVSSGLCVEYAYVISMRLWDISNPIAGAQSFQLLPKVWVVFLELPTAESSISSMN